jgi:RNA polymerase sigma factor (sigma-70 family)
LPSGARMREDAASPYAESVGALVAAHRERLIAAARRWLAPGQAERARTPEDAVSEALFRWLRAGCPGLPGHEQPCSRSSEDCLKVLLGFVRNVCRERMRSRRTRHKRLARVGRGGFQSRSFNTDPERAVEESEERRRVEDILRRTLTARQAEVITTYLDGCTAHEISQSTGCAPGTVKVHLRAARRRLRRSVRLRETGGAR